MTRGHVILSLLYIKMHRMSRNILEPEREPFRVCKRTAAQGAPSHFFMPQKRSLFAIGENQRVCFLRHTSWFFRPLLPMLSPDPTGKRRVRTGATAGNPQTINLQLIVFKRYFLNFRPGPRRMPANRPHRSVCWCAYCSTGSFAHLSRRVHSASSQGKDLGLTSPAGDASLPVNVCERGWCPSQMLGRPFGDAA
jgi:hypothetical protein